jgi:hypothetical protein
MDAVMQGKHHALMSSSITSTILHITENRINRVKSSIRREASVNLRVEAAMAARFVLAIIAAILLLDVGHSLRTLTSNKANRRVLGTCHRKVCTRMESSRDVSSIEESVPLKERIYLYNTLSKDKQLFTAVDKSKKGVSFYR